MPDSSRTPRKMKEAARYVAPQVSYLADRIVNVVFVGAPNAGDRGWVLVDAGLPGSAEKIKRTAEALFGAGARPSAIILTHGHLDHIGAIRSLVRDWDVPVYAHTLELPYLTGRSSYPPADPFVGGGAMALVSALLPNRPINLGEHVSALPADGTVPGLRGWRWIATPGHSPGHVSLVRDIDRVMIAGDAFVMTRTESLTSMLRQTAALHGPPKYLTPDWDAACASVVRLADFAPTATITGHGPPMHGATLQMELRRLSTQFTHRARPKSGRYRTRAAVADERGVVSVPPAVMSLGAVILSAMLVGGALALVTTLFRRRATEMT